MSKHTPGPWRTLDDEDVAGNPVITIEGGKEYTEAAVRICDVYGNNDGAFRDADHANARLIAASPRLYSIVERFAAAGDGESKSVLEKINAAS